MKKASTPIVIKSFQNVEDHRVAPKHLLIEIIAITILASICDANTYVDIANWGQSNLKWLKEYLSLPFGIPSHDTFTTVFRHMNPAQFEEGFLNWIQAIEKATGGDVIAIDGKALKGSSDKNNLYQAINMVSAWSACNNLILGQIKTASKSNEITAIPKLLSLLNIKNSIITIDAIGCQKAITEAIVEKNGDYVIALKQNQPTLYNAAQETFENLLENNGDAIDFHSTSECGHGRKEIRNYYIFETGDELEGSEGFANLSAIGVSENIRTENGETTRAVRFYILSVLLGAKMFASCVRSHWNIENKLHWCLDVTFKEDASKIRKGYGPENMSVARRIALNLLKNNGDLKKSLRAKRKLAGWDVEYLKKTVGF